jgi:23S rRNA (cytosine1962-C5)-methyltransferase
MSNTAQLPRVELPPKLEMSLLAGHPWVFREQLPTRLPPSGWVAVRAGKYEGFGLLDAESPLALRLYSWSCVPNEAWFAERFSVAWQSRQRLSNNGTNGFRWINGEGDGVPGVIVDHYAGFAVIVCDTPWLEPMIPQMARALMATAPLHGVVFRRRDGERGNRVSSIIGDTPPAKVVIEEHGIKMLVDLFHGQKTGLFLDHRENRKEFGTWAQGKRVLNLFSYTGGFSLHAACAGASSVVSVDSAPEAAVDARENFSLNGLDPAKHEFVVGDVFEYLAAAQNRGERFDLVVCDPPSFARNAKHLDKAKAAYIRCNAAGMRVLSSVGVYAAASCTARLTPAEFLSTVAAASTKARRVFQVRYEGGQAIDHPYRAIHPEGRYLKFVLGHVPERW